MAVADGGGTVSRAIAMLFQPARTWEAIALSPTPASVLLRRHIIPLAAIPAVGGVIGGLVFGFNIANVGVRMSQPGLILGAVSGYVVTLVAVWLLAQWIALTAPVFEGVRNPTAALNLVGYAATASWIGGLAELYPSIGIPIGILAALWSLYALYLGLADMLRIPERRQLTAFAAALVAVLLLGAARGLIVGWTTELGGPLSASYAPR